MGMIEANKDWLQNRIEEIALDLTGHEYHELGPHIQLACYMKAEQDWIDYYSSYCDSVYERELYRRMGL